MEVQAKTLINSRCVFCGSDKLEFIGTMRLDEPIGVRVRCKNCYAYGPISSEGEPEALSLYNNRVNLTYVKSILINNINN